VLAIQHLDTLAHGAAEECLGGELGNVGWGAVGNWLPIKDSQLSRDMPLPRQRRERNY